MKILVRLPNWLGDMVMSVGFIDQLYRFYPDAEVSVIVKKGLEGLLHYFPPIRQELVFNKAELKGLRGAWKFGKGIKKREQFDLFFSLPDSLSAAVMGFATGATKRIGFKKEMRGFFLTHTYQKPTGIHRVEEYISLLEKFHSQKTTGAKVELLHSFSKKNYVIVNINSEASSRRLTVSKAVELIGALKNAIAEKIILIGAPKERAFIDGVLQLLPKETVINKAGKTSLPELIEWIASARLMLTTDSGPAHLANALGVPTFVLFGAGDEQNTAPYNSINRKIFRLGKLSCEPCRKNTCMRYDVPQCLEQLNSYEIVQTIKKELENNA